MLNIEELKPKIIEALMPLNPNKIILFGSYAYGTPNEDSDVDIYIVTNDKYIPQTWNENFNIKKEYLTALNTFTDTFATDIIVHTKQMNEKFIGLKSSFSKKVYNEGTVLYAQP